MLASADMNERPGRPYGGPLQGLGMAREKDDDPAERPGFSPVGTIFRLLVIAAILALVYFFGGFGGTSPIPGDTAPQGQN